MSSFTPLLFLSLAFLLSCGEAEIVTVTNALDDVANPPAGSFRRAISDAQSGDTIDFAPAVSGTITLAGAELALAKNLTIIGHGADALAISGNQASRIFRVPSGVTVTIS